MGLFAGSGFDEIISNDGFDIVGSEVFDLSDDRVSAARLSGTRVLCRVSDRVGVVEFDGFVSISFAGLDATILRCSQTASVGGDVRWVERRSFWRG